MNESLHYHGERQCLVPGFLLCLESGTGSASSMNDTLAELKFISAGITYYNSRDKQVDVRAKSLQREYMRKCQGIDRKYCGSSPDSVGPLEQHLRRFGDLMGLVIGQYGEGSQGLHDLLNHIVDSRAKYMCHSSGSPLSDHQRNLILASYRRRLYVVAVRAQAKCLMSRLGHIGPGA